MKQQLELFFSSPTDLEFLTIEIQLDRGRIAEINRENGIDCLEIELFGGDPGAGSPVKLLLDEFIEKLIEARELIKDLNS